MKGSLAGVFCLALFLGGSAFASHDPSIDLKVEVLEVRLASAVHLRLTAKPLVDAPSLEISCELPSDLSVISDQALALGEKAGRKTTRLFSGTVKEKEPVPIDFWIQVPDAGPHEATIQATLRFPDSDWQLANAALIRLEGQAVQVQPLLPSGHPRALPMVQESTGILDAPEKEK